MPFSQNLSPKIQDQLAHKILVPLVGPTSVGKTSIMRAVVAADREFYRSGGFTTRPIRVNEESDTYRFLPNTNDERSKILKQFEQGQLIQFAIHPTTSYLYGTSIDDYKGKYNLVDVLSSEVSSFQSLGFAGCQSIMVIASVPDWTERFNSRNFSKDEAKKRITEGISSLKWGIDQEGAVRWVENKQDNMNSTVEHVIAIAKNKLHHNDSYTQQLAVTLLDYLQTLQVKL